MDLTQEINYILTVYSQTPRSAHGIIKKNTKLYNKISNLTGKTFSEKCKLFVSKLTTRPLCGCGDELKYLDFRRGYTQFCSTKCTVNSSIVQQKRKATCLKKYSVEHYSKTAEYKKKFKATCINRYGVKNPGMIDANKSLRARKKQLTFYNNLSTLEHAEPNFSFEEYTYVRDSELEWKCKNCGDIFKSHIFSKIPKCETCYPPAKFGGQSSIEKEIVAYIQSIYTGDIIENDRTIIAPKEIDIYIPEHSLAIEVNGVYWHSDKFLSKDYHVIKYDALNALGIKVLMVTDDDWLNKQAIVKRMISHRLTLTSQTCYARQCTVVEIKPSIAREFLDNNHINGFSPSSIHLGLQFNGDIVSVMSLSKRSRFNENKAELVRLAFNVSVCGALGKYLKYIRTHYKDIATLISYADLRYGNGDVYRYNNFVNSKQTPPGYWYYINNKMYHRLSWTKQKLIKNGNDANKTEFEIMDDLGALRIYDAGHIKYILEM